MGPDGLHPRLLKKLSKTIAPILQTIFEKSLETGKVPADWKTANVCPIFKKGERYNPANYRPVSLTCICSKLLEHIVTKHILKHLEQYNILYDLQHGFRSKRSTETQLLAFTQDVLRNLQEGRQTDVIIMDFAKAFDKVSHWRLSLKLQTYGINGKINQWVTNFLDGRLQRVVCNGEHSEWAPVMSGVPQGSVIGPLLFLIYINDLPENVKSKVRLFADDTILYHTIECKRDSKILQKDLDHLAAWEEKWKMKFHPQKCNVLRITRRKKPIDSSYQLHGHTLETLSDIKYLGVTVNNKLCWNTHINNICKKANNSLAFLRRNLQISQAHIKECAYTALIRPQLEYASCVWDPYTICNKDRIEMVQRRAARFVHCNYDQKASVNEMLRKRGWRSLVQRRVDARLVMFYKSLHGQVAVDVTRNLVPHTRVSRHWHPKAFMIPIEKISYLQNSYLPRTVAQWNSLPASIALSSSLEAFKEGVSSIQHN